jgi:hypothetical protein
VRFVYGDSRRWLAVWDMRSRGIALCDLFWQLWRMGLRGSWLCGAIVAQGAWAYVEGGLAARAARAWSRSPRRRWRSPRRPRP